MKFNIVSEKDRLIAKLKDEVNNLEKRLDEISLIDSAKLSSLQK